MGADLPPPKLRVLFVCLGNSCRSPMAEAITRHRASDILAATSAGTIALGFVAPFTTAVLTERGIDIANLHSKPLTRAAQHAADILVNMTGRPNEEVFGEHGDRALVWQITDPYGGPIEDYRESCDEIEAQLTELISRLRAKRAKTAKTVGEIAARQNAIRPKQK
jgi:arsenate reductase (thioredoxin)